MPVYSICSNNFCSTCCREKISTNHCSTCSNKLPSVYWQGQIFVCLFSFYLLLRKNWSTCHRVWFPPIGTHARRNVCPVVLETDFHLPVEEERSLFFFKVSALPLGDQVTSELFNLVHIVCRTYNYWFHVYTDNTFHISYIFQNSFVHSLGN